MTAPARPLLLVGLPRSGTTWTMRALASCAGGHRVLEPDNEDKVAAAIHAKHRLGRYPCLGPSDTDPAYRRLWAWILAGGRESWRARRARLLLGPGSTERIFEGRRDRAAWVAGVLARDPHAVAVAAGGPDPVQVVAKSIHAQLALEWLDATFDVSTLVLFRHPASVLASWLEVKLKDSRNSTLETRSDIRARYVDRWGVALPGPDPLERQCWRIGLLTAALEEAVARHPEWHVRTHEELCDEPPSRFADLFAELGLGWTPSTEKFLTTHDTPGEGFATNRVASELSSSWQHRLEPAQVATLRRVLDRFPITRWSDADFTLPGRASS